MREVSIREAINRRLDPIHARLARFSELIEKPAEAIKAWLHVLIPLALLLLAFALRLSRFAAVESMQNKVFDTFQTLRPRPYEDVPVRIIDIDDETLSRLGQWPWPRTTVARVVSRLSELGASAIAFDLIFSEPDRVSPDQILPLLPQVPGMEALRATVKSLPTNDQVLVSAIAKAKVVSGFTMTTQENGGLPASKGGFAYSGDSPLSYLGDFPGAVVNLPEIDQAASGVGSLTVIEEGDGIIRRMPLLVRRGANIYPALSLEALRVAQGASGFVVKSAGASGVRSFGQHTGISQIKAGSIVIPTDSEGRVWVYYTAAAPERTIPLWQIFEPGFRREKVEGSIVFVGASSPRLKDLRTTPMSPASPGVEVHAQLTEQALLKRFMHRPDWADGVELSYMLVLGVGLILLLPRLGAVWCGLIGFSAAAAAFALSWHAYTRLQLLIDPLFPSLVAILIYMSSSLVSFINSEAERRRLIIIDAVKDDFMSTVSHDLRGPVNAMVMIVDMMSRGMYGPLTEKQMHNLQLVKDSGRKLTAFVSNILDSAKIKAGKMEFRKGEVRLQEVLPNLVELFTLSATARGVAIDHKFPADLPSIDADREKLEQVINNLVGNAMKFTPQGGKITLEGDPEGADFVRISVSDTGLGISKEDLPKLFKKFQQVDLAQQKEMKVVGTGLGLAICKTVVEAHGGRIWVDSEKGKGSSFRFTMPRFTGTPH